MCTEARQELQRFDAARGRVEAQLFPEMDALAALRERYHAACRAIERREDGEDAFELREALTNQERRCEALAKEIGVAQRGYLPLGAVIRPMEKACPGQAQKERPRIALTNWLAWGSKEPRGVR